MKNFKFDRKGITLIALVITIIVLLILAGVTIATLMGDNGILTKAQQAKTKTEEAQNQENETLQNYEDTIDYILSPNAGTIIEDIPEEWTSDNVTAISDGEGSVIPLPEGFCYIGGTKSEGIVISDNSTDVGKGTSHEVAQTLQGNQFVWVPIENDNDFKTYEGYINGDLQDITNYDEPTNAEYQYPTEQVEYNSMKASVLKYNGFYVGRYETGTTETGTGLRGKPTIKQGGQVYNNIKWGNSMTDASGGAVEVAKGMYPKDKGYSVTSTLIYGVQWDAIMSWIDPKYKTGNCDTNTSFVANSNGKGYYEQSGPTITGSNASYSVKNIYDLAGNVFEWTMESCSNKYKARRGGYFEKTGYLVPASSRYDGYTPSDFGHLVGFRIALYIEG